MTKTRRKNPYNEQVLPVRMIGWSIRLLIFGVVVLIFAFGLLTLFVRFRQAQAGASVAIDQGSSELSSAEQLVLQTYLLANNGQLAEPAASGTGIIDFSVEPGQNANQIAIKLSRAGVLDPNKETLFLNYLRYYGLDAQLEAGTYKLSPADSIPELAKALADATGDSVTVRFLEGWRYEQMIDYLDAVKPANVDPAQFAAIVEREADFDTSAYAFVSNVSGESLEGYLFPDTYEIALDATAVDLVTVMLNNFDSKLSPQMRQSYGERGLTIRQAVTLASIVEREAVIGEERPTIASVYLNRVRDGIKLEADPTVQYAVGFNTEEDTWWKAGLTLDDLALDSPYNTYVYLGIPPDPIANPGLGSLQAVADPAVTDYFYFVANCEGYAAGQHLFSTTFDEHLVKVENCR